MSEALLTCQLWDDQFQLSCDYFLFLSQSGGGEGEFSVIVIIVCQ